MTQKVTFDNSIKANFEDDTYSQIEDKSRREGISKSAAVRQIVRKHFRG